MLNRRCCSTATGTGGSKYGSLNGSRKRPPQRGLGVAQLERMRLQEEERIISQQKIMLHSTMTRRQQQQQQQQYYRHIKQQLQLPDPDHQLQQGEFSLMQSNIPHDQQLHQSLSQHLVVPRLHIFFPNNGIDATNTSATSSDLHNTTYFQDDIISPPLQVDAVLPSSHNHDGSMINHLVPSPLCTPDWPPTSANSSLPSTISFSHQAPSQLQQQQPQQTKQQEQQQQPPQTQQRQHMANIIKLPASLISGPTRFPQQFTSPSFFAEDPSPTRVQQELGLNPSLSWSLPTADHSWSSKPTTCTDTGATNEIRLWPPAVLSMIPLQKMVYLHNKCQALQKDSPSSMGQLYSPTSCLGATLKELPSLQNSGPHDQQIMCSAWPSAVPGLQAAAERYWRAGSMDLNAAASEQLEAKTTLRKEGCSNLLIAPREPFSPRSTSSNNIAPCKAANWEDKGSLLSLGQYSSPDHSSTVSSFYENKHMRSDICCCRKKAGCSDGFLKLGLPISNETCTINLTMEHKQHDIQQPTTCEEKEQSCEKSCHGILKVSMIKRTPRDDLFNGDEPTIIDLELRLSLPRFIG